MKKIYSVLVLLMFLLIPYNKLNAQTYWNAGNYYAYKGQTSVEYSYQVQYDRFGRPFQVRYCRVLNWYQEYREGYIYLWNSYTGRWYTEYRRGYFWYCTWSNWYIC